MQNYNFIFNNPNETTDCYVKIFITNKDFKINF